MLDLFNTKKLQDAIKNRDYYERMYKKQVTETNSLLISCREKDKHIKSLEANYETLCEENRKLIDWLQKVIHEVGSYEVRSSHSIKIPIYKHEEEILQDGFISPYVEQDIYIPEVHFKKIRGGGVSFNAK